MTKTKNAEWIKVDVDILTNDKLIAIREEKNGLLMELLWFKMLCLAGNCNDEGKLSITNGVPFKAKNIAKKTEIPIEIVEQALELFQELNMIKVVNGFYCICDWMNHQNEKYMNDRKKAYDRRYQKERREKASNPETVENTEVSEQSLENRTTNLTIPSVSVSIINTMNEDIEVDMENAWKNTFKIYPKQDSPMLARTAWIDMVKNVDRSQRKEVAKLIFSATKLYIKRFEESQSYKDNNYKYLKSFERFLKEDCLFLMQEIENKQTGS